MESAAARQISVRVCPLPLPKSKMEAIRLAKLVTSVRAGEAADDQRDAGRSEEARGNPIHPTHLGALSPRDDAQQYQAYDSAYPRTTREGDKQRKAVQSETHPVDQAPGNLALLKRQSQGRP